MHKGHLQSKVDIQCSKLTDGFLYALKVIGSFNEEFGKLDAADTKEQVRTAGKFWDQLASSISDMETLKGDESGTIAVEILTSLQAAHERLGKALHAFGLKFLTSLAKSATGPELATAVNEAVTLSVPSLTTAGKTLLAMDSLKDSQFTVSRQSKAMPAQMMLLMKVASFDLEAVECLLPETKTKIDKFFVDMKDTVLSLHSELDSTTADLKGYCDKYKWLTPTSVAMFNSGHVMFAF